MHSTVGRDTERRDEGADDDAVEIRYSLTALGEAILADPKATRFRGFGPCAIADWVTPVKAAPESFFSDEWPEFQILEAFEERRTSH